jgi:hypothetical protein
MTDILNLLLNATADYYPDDPAANRETEAKCRRIRSQVVDQLTLFERDFPETELSPFVHEVLHVSEFIYRWNSVRNYWCFVTERFVGWMKGLVMNRSLSLENMVPVRIRATLHCLNLTVSHYINVHIHTRVLTLYVLTLCILYTSQHLRPGTTAKDLWYDKCRPPSGGYFTNA